MPPILIKATFLKISFSASSDKQASPEQNGSTYTDDHLTEASEQARLALIAYAEQELFMYDPSCYAPSTSLAINAYIAHVQLMRRRMLLQLERDEIVELDQTRSQLHRAVAQAVLDEDIVPNIKLGRTLARLVLVAEGIEAYQDAIQMF